MRRNRDSLDRGDGPGSCRRNAIAHGDILALVAGLALVLALSYENRPEFLRSAASLSSYPLRLYIVAEAVGKACLALLPVSRVRCARDRRMARPAEFLLACAGLPWLVQGVESLHLLRWLSHRFGMDHPDMLSIPVRAYDQWETETEWPRTVALLGIAAQASLALWLSRLRWPGWL
jgi:hypothetical protein